MVKINGNTDLYALMGYPAKHSLSPFIHNYFFNKYDLNSVYLSFEIIPSDFKTAFSGAKKIGFSGINLTMPFKEDSLNYLEELDEDAKAIKSANTVKINKNERKTKGFNTDISGLIRSLDDHNFNWGVSSCLIIGAGGAAKSAVYALIKKKTEKIYIFSRTASRANEIKILFNNHDFTKIIILNDLNIAPLKEISLIINCTPLGMKLNDSSMDNNILPIPESWNLNKKFVFEMVYNPTHTVLVKKSIKDGAEVIFGTEMLLNQAAFSFEIWKGFFPDLTYLKNYFKNSIK